MLIMHIGFFACFHAISLECSRDQRIVVVVTNNCQICKGSITTKEQGSPQDFYLPVYQAITEFDVTWSDVHIHVLGVYMIKPCAHAQ